MVYCRTLRRGDNLADFYKGGKIMEDKEDKNEEWEKEELKLMVLRNLSARFLPISFSLEELAKADSILIIKGTILEIFLNFRNNN